MLKVPVDGGKYTIEQDDAEHRLVVRHHGEPWLDMPPGSKMLISVAYELGVLRRIAAAALDHLSVDGAMKLEVLMKEMDGYCDWRRNLADPGEI